MNYTLTVFIPLYSLPQCTPVLDMITSHRSIQLRLAIHLSSPLSPHTVLHSPLYAPPNKRPITNVPPHSTVIPIEKLVTFSLQTPLTMYYSLPFTNARLSPANITPLCIYPLVLPSPMYSRSRHHHLPPPTLFHSSPTYTFPRRYPPHCTPISDVLASRL